jgi:hypothetical protein
MIVIDHRGRTEYVTPHERDAYTAAAFWLQVLTVLLLFDLWLTL